METDSTATIPDPPSGHEIATLGAGCYWCVEAVYQRLEGITAIISGFIGGQIENPTYEQVCAGNTGHAEVVRIIFNPEKISYSELLEWFWKLHDPTQKDGQGTDIGTQYRSGIFYHNDSQKEIASQSKSDAQKNFTQPIVTEITKATQFYPAKVSHQDYYRINGQINPYCRAVITPKLQKLNLED